MKGTLVEEIQLTAGLTLIIFSLGLGFPAILDFRNGSFKMELEEIKNYFNTMFSFENSIGYDSEPIVFADTGTDENFIEDQMMEFFAQEFFEDKIFNVCTCREINFEKQ